MYLSLNQGTTRYEGGEFRPRADTDILDRVELARDVLSDLLNEPGWELDINLGSDPGKLGIGYELGNVVCKKYERVELPGDDLLRQDLTYGIQLLARLYERTDSTDDELPKQKLVPQRRTHTRQAGVPDDPGSADASRIRELKDENLRLKMLLADAELDKQALRTLVQKQRGV